MEEFVRRHERTLYFLGFLFLIWASAMTYLKFPEELRGGAVLRLNEIEANYAHRQEEIKYKFAEMELKTNNIIDNKYEIIQSQLRSMYEMRNDP